MRISYLTVVFGLLLTACGGEEQKTEVAEVRSAPDAPYHHIALYVAIDKYSEESRITPLRGCVNDMRRLRGVLQSRYGFKRFRFIKDSRATRDGIYKGMVWLVEQTRIATQEKKLEDVVVVLGYAGHGGRVVGNDPTEPDKLDDTWVTYDSTKTNVDNHIRDNDINRLLGKLEDLGAMVVYITDACYSGTSFRSAPCALVRSVEPDPNAPPLEGAKGSIFAKEGWPLHPNRRLAPYAACSELQDAHEGKDKAGRPCGRFSYSLYKVLKRDRAAVTYDELAKKTRIQFNRDWTGDQEPQFNLSPAIKGDRLFATEPVELHAEVMWGRRKKADLCDITLGHAHGVHEGAVVKIYRDLPDLTKRRRPLATGKVKKVLPATAVVKLDKAIAAPGKAAVATVDAMEFGEFAVYLDPKVSAPYRAELTELGMPVVGQQEAFDVALYPHKTGVRIYDPAALPTGGESSHIEEAASPAQLKEKLSILAQIRRLMALEHNDGIIQVSFDPTDDQKDRELPEVDGVRRFKDETRIPFTIDNPRDHTIWVYGFLEERSLKRRHIASFINFWPGGPDATWKYEIPGGAKGFKLIPPQGIAGTTAYIDEDFPKGGSRFTFKFLFTNKKYPATKFHHLKAKPPPGSRGEGDDEFTDLLGKVARGERTRGYGGGKIPVWWSTATVEFDVVDE